VGQYRGSHSAIAHPPSAAERAAGSPQTDAGPQTNDQASPAKRSDRPPGDLSDAGPTNQYPSAQGANRTVGVGQTGPAGALTSMSPPTTPAQALAVLQGIAQTQGSRPVKPASPSQQGPEQTISVSRLRPALILPQSTTRTVPQGAVQAVLPFQQRAAANQTAGAGQMGPAGAPASSMSSQGMIGRPF
jgi:hypothetical protein